MDWKVHWNGTQTALNHSLVQSKVKFVLETLFLSYHFLDEPKLVEIQKVHWNGTETALNHNSSLSTRFAGRGWCLEAFLLKLLWNCSEIRSNSISEMNEPLTFFSNGGQKAELGANGAFARIREERLQWRMVQQQTQRLCNQMWKDGLVLTGELIGWQHPVQLTVRPVDVALEHGQRVRMQKVVTACQYLHSIFIGHQRDAVHFHNVYHCYLLGWKLSPVVFYHWLTARNTTGLSFQPNNTRTRAGLPWGGFTTERTK